jgi:HD-GYP domain-containing protein (c-di-GMP phosphodiesterase class II)
VARYAGAIGERLGLTPDALIRLRRAALLHDVGMLGVSSRTIEKVGPLNVLERTAMEQHPLYTWDLLRRAGPFADVALDAALHHERLDGSGYPWHRSAEDLDVPARALAVADTYDAITSARSFRPGLSSADAFQILDAHRDLRLDADAIEALAAALAHDEPAPNDL